MAIPDCPPIRDITYINVEIGSPNEDGRDSRVDVLCASDGGEVFHAEVQRMRHKNYRDRSVYYPSTLVQRQGRPGDWDFDLAPVYSLSIMDFAFRERPATRPDSYHNVVQLRNRDGDLYYDKLTIVYIELPLFRKAEAELDNDFERWLYLLRHTTELEGLPEALERQVFQNFLDMAAIANLTQDEYIAYEFGRKGELERKAHLALREEEITEEVTERVTERVKRETAETALREGLSLQLAAKLSGLPEEVVATMARELNLS